MCAPVRLYPYIVVDLGLIKVFFLIKFFYWFDQSNLIQFIILKPFLYPATVTLHVYHRQYRHIDITPVLGRGFVYTIEKMSM